MKHYFIINPAAGKGKRQAPLEEDIHKCCRAEGVDYTVYHTREVGDAEKYVHERCAEGVECRFYACGGDGTLCEVVNGAAESDIAEVAVIPVGTGNDFARNFTSNERFGDIKAQLHGMPRRIDIIKYNDRYFANMINTGFDCEVVRRVTKIKRNPAIPRALAYVVGVFIELIKKPGVRMRVSVDGRPPEEKQLLLTCIGNGAFCGGGFNSAPHASLCDGIIDVCFIKNVTRRKFISLLSSYKNGTYLKRNDVKEIAEYVRAARLEIDFVDLQGVSVDGEIEDCRHLSLNVISGGLKFSIPEGCEVIEPEEYRAEAVRI